VKRLFRHLGSGRRATREEVDDEIHAHLGERASELRASGMTEEEAREEARRRFGDVAAARRRLYRSARRRDHRLGAADTMDALRKDLRLAVHRMRTNPGFSALTVAVFAVGIGLTTLSFGVIDQVLLRSLPFPSSHELVQLRSVPESRNAFDQVSASNWADWRDRSSTLGSTAIHRDWDVTVLHGGRAVRVQGAGIAGAFFETLRPDLIAGRAISEAEAEARQPVAVISEGYWVRAFGAEPELGGIRLRVDGEAMTVVGVVRAGQAFPEGTQLWTPASYLRLTGAGRNNVNWGAVARLAPDADLRAARTELQAIADGIRESDPEGIYSWGVGVRPLRDAMVGEVRSELQLLFWATAIVLLVACVNVAGLSLTRGEKRRREFAVRTALGAGRRRLVNQLMVEQVLVATVGGIVGVLLASWATTALGPVLEAHLPRGQGLTVELRVLGIGMLLTLGAGVVAGVVPALRVSNVAPAHHLGGTPGSRRRGKHLPGGVLVVTEVALAVALLSGAGLLYRSFDALLSRDLGYDGSGVAISLVTLNGTPHVADGAGIVSFWERTLTGLDALPGVTPAITNAAPTTSGGGTTFLSVEGVEDADVGAGYRVISEGYFRVLGIPLLSGRLFEPSDLADGERVVVINRAFADHYWPGESALGRRVRADSFESWIFGGEAPWLTVVGVVDDILHWGFESEPRPEMYTLYRQAPALATHMYVTVASDRTPAAQIREAIAALDPGIAVELEGLGERVSDVMAERRLMMGLLGAFSLITLGLASIGLYGLIAHAVAERRREMALRMALGARALQIRGLVLAQGLRVVGVGLAPLGEQLSGRGGLAIATTGGSAPPTSAGR